MCISVSSRRDTNGQADAIGLLHVVLRADHARRIRKSPEASREDPSFKGISVGSKHISRLCVTADRVLSRCSLSVLPS